MNSALKIGFFTGLIVLFFSFSLSSVQALGNPVKISDSTYAPVFPQVVTDTIGYLHIIWMEVVDENKVWGSHANPGILYSRWNGDTWSTPLKISENSGFAEMPAIAADSNNTVHTVWDDETYGQFGRVAYKTRSSAGTWSIIEVINPPAGTFYNWNARIAIDPSNVPNVTFSAATVLGDSIYWTRKVSDTWQEPQLISEDASGNILRDCQFTDILSDTAGNISALYWCWNEGTFYRSFNGSTWSTPFLVTNQAEGIRMAITPQGKVFVAWQQASDNSVWVRWSLSGVWQDPLELSPLAERTLWSGIPITGVTTDSKERAHVGWGERDAGNLIDLRYRSYDPGSNTWGGLRDVDLDNNEADSPFVYPDKWDNQHFAWTEKNPSTSQWEIMYRVAEGTIQTVTTAGGSITANPNNITYATLDIPNGALSAITEIGIQIGPVPQSVDPLQITIPRSFTFRPNGLFFNTPSTATVFYNDAELGGADERQLKPWFWNSQTNAWEARSGTINRAQNRITVSLPGFSLYGISAPIINANDYLTTFIAPKEENNIIKQSSYLIQFQLGMADGSEFLPPELPEDLKLVLVNENGETMQELFYEPSGINHDNGKDRYKGTLNFQRLGLGMGEYKLEIYLLGYLIGSRNFSLLK